MSPTNLHVANQPRTARVLLSGGIRPTMAQALLGGRGGSVYWWTHGSPDRWHRRSWGPWGERVLVDQRIPRGRAQALSWGAVGGARSPHMGRGLRVSSSCRDGQRATSAALLSGLPAGPYPARRRRGDHAVLEGERDRLELGVDPELDEHVLDVGADRVERQEAVLGDPAVGVPGGQVAEDLALAGAQRPHQQVDGRVASGLGRGGRGG